MADRKQTREKQVDDTPSPRAGGYASTSIIERRHRILSATRKLIARQGIADFSMDDVAAQAEVSKRTLYNVFKSRELLIAAAIKTHFEDFEIKIKYSTPEATPERLAEHLAIVVQRNLAVREYTRTLLTIFFSGSAESDVREAISEIAAHSHRPWIERLHQEGQLHPWIDPQVLIGDLVRYRYAVGLDWAQGRIADDRFAPTVIIGVLTLVAGACRQRARREIVAVLRDWSRSVTRN